MGVIAVVGAIQGLQSGGAAERDMAETRQTRQLEKDKKDNLKKRQ